MQGDATQAWRANKVRDWLLAVLRLAVTLDRADAAAVLAMASKLDRSTHFSFFSRTSRELCDAISHNGDPHKLAVLHRLLTRIEDQRLRRALETAFTLPVVRTPAKRRKDSRRDLWAGLTAPRR